MPSVFQKASTAFRGNHAEQAEKPDEENDDGESLTTVLDADEDRAALTILIADITELMRKQILDAFDPKETGGTQDLDPALEDSNSEPTEGEKVEGDEQDKKTQKILEKQKADLAKREKEVGEAKMVALKTAALNFFDDWRDSVLLRVGAVVNSQNTAKEQQQHAKPETSQTDDGQNLEGVEKTEYDDKIDETLLKLYPPVKNELRQLAKEKRALILHSVLLLLLSLEHYKAHSRTLMLYLTTSLGLSVTLLSDDESKIARGLLAAAKQMSADEETKRRADENRTARRWKMGIAGVAGAALIGITGGLAAPLLAAGLGTVMGGIGLGATATAGYLGALAGSGVLVGGLFGAYGGRMTSKAMEKYSRDVEDFAFVPVGESGKNEIDSRRLRIAIGISGWLSDKDDVVTPWTIIGSGQESFALRFELEALINLGNSLTTLITSAAWTLAKSQIIRLTVFAALTAGLWPLALLKASHIIDNPWSIANQRAQKAGEVLADALINKAQGERPVTLIGYSLGAKVIYTCLQQLAQRKAFGLIENVILLGTPASCSSAYWRRIRSVVTGRVVNAYSTKDYILAFLYRSSSVQLGVAGLHPVLNVKGVENVDISDLVEGHTLYRYATGPVLKRIGFEDVNLQEVERGERLLKEQDKKEREQREAVSRNNPASTDAEDGDVSKEEVEKMEREIEEKNKKSNTSWMSEKMKRAGNVSGGALEKAKSKWRSGSKG
ncbi:DUF726-domain-containing protein [Whalleya microplaca]|nr:DUF726-domain-containing protein [Whalleya microplaca]